jgi:kynurenine formamidase
MDKRVQFDFEIYFTNGGSLKGQDFRLDIEGDNISDKELTDYIVEDLRLLMVAHLCNLHMLPEEGFTFSVAPSQFKGAGTFPVRAMAKFSKTR